MGKTIVPLEGANALEEARGWEGRIFGQVCEEGQREAQRYLAELEEVLFEQRPAGWVVVGYRERVLVTRMGAVRLRRRLYRDEPGEYHFLLDEYLGLKAYQGATPEMQAMCTKLSAEMSFRKAAEALADWMAGLLSHSTSWRLLQRTGQAAVDCGKHTRDWAGRLRPKKGGRPIAIKVRTRHLAQLAIGGGRIYERKISSVVAVSRSAAVDLARESSAFDDNA